MTGRLPLIVWWGSPRLRRLLALGAVAMIGCKSPTDAGDGVIVTISSTPSTRYPGCVSFSPATASVRVGQGLRFKNEGSAAITVFQEGPSAIPLTTVSAGSTSSALKWSSAGYFRLFTNIDCGSSYWPGIGLYVTQQ